MEVNVVEGVAGRLSWRELVGVGRDWGIAELVG